MVHVMVGLAVLSGIGGIIGVGVLWDAPASALVALASGVVSALFWAALAAVLGNQQAILRELTELRGRRQT